MSKLDPRAVENMVRAALDEDGVDSDATIAGLGIGEALVAGTIVAREEVVVAGMELAATAFRLIDADAAIRVHADDGERVSAGGELLVVEGTARSVIGAERVALNFLQRLCGIATLASQFVERVAGTGVTILDTRKTTPLWRDMEKYAVRCGGAQNHRRDLESMVLIKENHIHALGGESALVSRLEQEGAGRSFVEVEVDSLPFLSRLLGAPINRVMLDNFKPAELRAAIDMIAEYGDRHPHFSLETEVSGGITLETVRDFALPGVDFISVGALTHSARSVDLSLEVR